MYHNINYKSNYALIINIGIYIVSNNNNCYNKGG